MFEGIVTAIYSFTLNSNILFFYLMLTKKISVLLKERKFLDTIFDERDFFFFPLGQHPTL